MSKEKPKEKQEINLYDYMLTYQKGDELVIESVIQKIGFYEAYVRALDRLKSKK